MERNSWRRIPVIRLLVPRPHLTSSVLVAVLIYALIPFFAPMEQVTRILLGYNLGAFLYVLLTARMIQTSTVLSMRRRALTQDEGKLAILLVVVVSSVASLMAIAVQLAAAKDMQGLAKSEHIALAACTVLTSWAFTQVMFALHYAHEFYHHSRGHQGGGLDFPSTSEPNYWDFLYFSCIIGTSGQTADVAISDTGMRRLTLVHCVLAYFFNTTLLALTINIAAGLL